MMRQLRRLIDTSASTKFEEMCDEIDLPLLDLSLGNLSDEGRRREVTRALLDCFSTVGFCLVTGIEEYDSGELFRLTKWFHYEVPEDAKLDQLATKTFNPKNNNLYRGYFPLKEGALSYKQGYDMGPELSAQGLQEGNPFRERTPKLKIPGMEKELEHFYQVMYKHQDILSKKAALILSLVAEAGEEDPDFFAPMFELYPMQTLRPLRYPKRVDSIPKGAYLPDGRIISTPAHMDSGFVTLLETFEFPGLEIQVDGVWYKVPSKPNSLVVNLGEQMTAMSNGRFKATIHRVIDIAEDRFSIPFFFEPNCEANINVKIPRSLLPPETLDKEEDDASYYPFGAFLLNKLPIYAEYATLAENLPQWMKDRYLNLERRGTCWATQNGIEIDGMSYEDGSKKKKKKKSVSNGAS